MQGSGNLANFIIAGVNKAGSTSLFHYFSAHPEVCGSKDKETCYFLPLLYGKPVGPITDYEAQFTSCQGSKYRMEATPAYVYGGETIAETIYNTLGPVKILIILKDPVERMLSFYQRKKATFQLSETISLSEYIDICLSKTPAELDKHENQVFTGIYLGEYHRFLDPWFEIFRDQLKVVFFDDLRKDSRGFMKELSDWLEIDSEFYDSFDFSIKNKSLNYKNRYLHKVAVTSNNIGQRIWRKNPEVKKLVLGLYYKLNGKPFGKEEIDRESINRVRNYFKPHNKKLQELLEIRGFEKFPEWLMNERELV